MKHTTFFKKTVYGLFAVILSLVILEVCLRLGGAVFLLAQEYRNRAALNRKNNYKILCLGESTTALGGRNSYPSQLEKILNQKDPGISFSVINKGIPATRTHEILLQLKKLLDKYNPDIVTTMIGINDNWDWTTDEVVYRGRKGFLRSLRLYKVAEWLYYRLNKDARAEKQYAGFAMAKNSKTLAALSRQEELLENTIKTDPHDDSLYLELGLCCEDQGKFRKSEKALRRAIEINPDNTDAYFELGICLQRQGKYLKSEKAFDKAMAISPDYWPTYVQMGASYRMQKQYAKAKELMQEAITKFPGTHWFYFGLGMCHIRQGEYDEAETFLKKAIETDKDHENVWSYIELGRCYNRKGREKEADEMFRAALSIDPDNQWASFELGILDKSARRIELDNPAMHYNYRKIAEEILRRGMTLVCVQYPMRSVQTLEQTLAPYKEKIIFVDNEMPFKTAVMKEEYEKYFSDRFAGDFGHATPDGNRILAENIADAILHKALPSKD